jgi:antiphage defense system Thoeris ThsB-like protein
MGYRNKTYVCFDGDNDIKMYQFMKAWKGNKNFDFNFYDAHEFNNIWSESKEETIKKRLRERMNNAKVLVVLIGEKTKCLYKYVRYEIELAIKADIPIIAVNLNKKKEIDFNLCPAIIKNTLAIHIPYGVKIMQYALENWPTSHENYRKKEKNVAYRYNESVYKKLGL